MALSREDSEDGNLYLRPRSRKPFELASTPSSNGSVSPLNELSYNSQNGVPSSTSAPSEPASGTVTPSRTRSILNLTSSTLYGIYQGTAYATDRDEPPTPGGTGALTPIGESRHPSLDLSRTNIPDSVIVNGPNGKTRRRRSTIRPNAHRPKKSLQNRVIPVSARLLTLFATGMLYGALITHLHDRRELAPVKIEGIRRSSWSYLGYWGTMGILFGEALPWLDRFWKSAADQEEDEETDEAIEDESNNTHAHSRAHTKSSPRGGQWNDVLRSVGIFIGVAFAIRKLPWQSTLQVSLTLALTNPAIWYLIDRSGPGFLLSSLVSLSGTAVLLGTNPQLVPTPRTGSGSGSGTGLRSSSSYQLFNSKPPSASSGLPGQNATFYQNTEDELVLGMFSQESVGVATWIASVLFVSAVCFGNIGRRFAVAS